MVIPSLPQTLVPAVSFLAWFAVNWLKHSALKPRDNALIALLVPVFVALIWAACSGGFTQNLWGDIGLIIVLSYAALALPELESWRQWLQDTLTSPFALWDAPTVVDSGPAITATNAPLTPYLPPQALDLRGVAPASSRVSRIPFDSSFHPMPPVLPTGPTPAVAPPPEAEPVEEEATPTEQS